MKGARAAVVLVMIALGTLVPLVGIGPPDVGPPSFGFLRDVDIDPPGWADGFLDALKQVKQVKNGVVALLVLAAAFGEYQRRQRAASRRDPSPDGRAAGEAVDAGGGAVADNAKTTTEVDIDVTADKNVTADSNVTEGDESAQDEDRGRWDKGERY